MRPYFDTVTLKRILAEYEVDLAGRETTQREKTTAKVIYNLTHTQKVTTVEDVKGFLTHFMAEVIKLHDAFGSNKITLSELNAGQRRLGFTFETRQLILEILNKRKGNNGLVT